MADSEDFVTFVQFFLILGVLYQPLTELVSENEISKEICSWKMKT